MNCHPDRSEPGSPGERSGATCGSRDEHPIRPEVPFVHYGSLTFLRQVEGGNGVREAVAGNVFRQREAPKDTCYDESCFISKCRHGIELSGSSCGQPGSEQSHAGE
jgi:hypothetical protein